MSKHTPGPWYCEKHNPDAEFTAIGEPIAIIGGEATGEQVQFTVGRTSDYGPHGREMTAANAALICAAPELLTAVERISRELQVWAQCGSDPHTLVGLVKAWPGYISDATNKIKGGAQ